MKIITEIVFDTIDVIDTIFANRYIYNRQATETKEYKMTATVKTKSGEMFTGEFIRLINSDENDTRIEIEVIDVKYGYRNIIGEQVF